MEIENPPPERERRKVNDEVREDGKEDQNEKDEDGGDEDEEPSNLKVSFLCVIMVQDVIITASEEGYLFVWEGNRIKQKQQAHKYTIGTLSAKRESNLFVSGSLDGRVCLWEITPASYNYQIRKIQEYSLTQLASEIAFKMPESQIQSICVGLKYILVGTKSGDIYELLLPQYSDDTAGDPRLLASGANKTIGQLKEDLGEDEGEEQATQMAMNNLATGNNAAKQSQINLRLSCHDQEIPLALAFADDSRYLYSITQKGFFCVWDMQTLSRVFMKFFNKDTQGLIVCKMSSKIYLAFDSEIQILKNDIVAARRTGAIGGSAVGTASNSNVLRSGFGASSAKGMNNGSAQGNQQQQQYLFESLKAQPLDSTISDIKLSRGEKLLAVAIQNKINIYSPVGDEMQPSLKLMCTISNLASPVEYIDFTVDDNFLLYKDTLEEVSIIDLSNQKKINTIFIEHDIEWCSDGIKIGEKTNVHSHYSDENKILKITLVAANCIAVTDEMGTIRLFNYPCDSGSGSGYLRCYPDHLNNINQCVVSPDKRFLVTSSERDRCVFIWTIFENTFAKTDLDDPNEFNENNEEDDQN